AEIIGNDALAASDEREGEAADIVLGKAFAIGCRSLLRNGCVLEGEHDGGSAVGEGGLLVGPGGPLKALLERVHLAEIGEHLAGLDEVRAGKAAVLARLG